MRRIIEGKVYDTETAQMVCDVSPPGCYSQTDFKWEDTSLYCTRKGQFFLAGEGNAASRWAKPANGNMTGPGEGIRLVSKEDAASMAEERASWVVYTQFFGEPEEG